MQPELTTDATPSLQVFEIGGRSVILDADVARLFQVETRSLNQQIRRNADKFDGFAFRLSDDEFAALTSQNVMSNGRRGGSRHSPYVLTEHGVVMAATVVKSEQAIAASRFIIKVFVEARRKTPDGSNLPSLIDARRLTPLETEARISLASKLNTALGRVLDPIADPVAQTTVRDEARALAAEGLASLKEHLRKAGAQNEKTLAEVRKRWRKPRRWRPRRLSGSPRTSIVSWRCWPSSCGSSWWPSSTSNAGASRTCWAC